MKSESPEMILFNKVAELSKEYFEQFIKYFLIIIGILLLLVFYIVQSVYFPSSHAAYNQLYPLGTFIPYFLTPVFFGLSITLIVFEMSENKSPELDNIAMGTYTIIFLMLFLAGLALFFNGSREKTNTKIQQILATHGPYPITDSINKQIAYYREQLGTKDPVTLCENFYEDITGDADCNFCSHEKIIEKIKGIIGNPPNYILYYQRTKGPRLCDFYIASSYNTCVVKDQAMFYVSENMIEVALMAGARMLDFEIFDHGFGYDTIPIVTTGAEEGNYHLQQNYITFEACCAKLRELLYSSQRKSPIVHTGIPNEPVFLNLRLKTNGNALTHQKIAVILKDYFFDHLMTPDKYSCDNIVQAPLHQFFDIETNDPRIVVFVDGKNIWDDLTEIADVIVEDPSDYYFGRCNGVQRLSWVDANSTSDTEGLINVNKSAMTMVYPSMDIYSFSKIKGRKDVFEAAQNAKTINNDPKNPLLYGCQFVFMNYQTYDTNLNNYLSFFKKCNFVLKKEILRGSPSDDIPISKSTNNDLPLNFTHRHSY